MFKSDKEVSFVVIAYIYYLYTFFLVRSSLLLSGLLISITFMMVSPSCSNLYAVLEAIVEKYLTHASSKDIK